jgi:hypothetical protein
MTGQPVRLSRHHSVAWLLAPPVLLGAPVAGLAIGRLIDGPDELEQISGEHTDWTLPLAFVAAVMLLFVACWVVSALVLRAMEERDVRRSLADPIACWPQYESHDQWAAFVARERSTAPPTSRLVRLAPVAAVAVTATGLAVGAPFDGAMIGGSLGGFVGGLILTGWWSRVRTSRLDRALDAHRDRLADVPGCTVSLRGVLDDDLGVTTFTHLARASHVSSADLPSRRAELAAARRRGDGMAALDPIDRRLAKAGWSFLELTFDQRVTRSFAAGVLRLFEPWHVRSAGLRWTLLVRVPPGASAEADVCAAALQARFRLEPVHAE